MKRFDKIVEEWASVYKPMQHDAEVNRRYFNFDSIVSIPQFAGQMDINRSPAVGFEFHKEGTITGGKVLPVYTIYFLVRTETDDPTNKDMSADAVAEAEIHAHKFLAWLYQKQQKDSQFRELDLKNIDYGTIGPMLNNWYALFIQINDVEQINQYRCVDSNDYV